MPATSAQAKHPAYRLRQELDGYIIQKESSIRCFIPQRSIDKCWPEDPQQLKDKLGLYSWKGPHGLVLINVLRRECRVIASILAWIEYHDFAEKLKVLCSKIHRGEAILKDSDLIIERTRCEDIFGSQAGHSFYQDQFIFKPIVIKSAPEVVQRVHPDSRWPWESSTKEIIGSGAYGKVYKVNIVKGQLQPTPDPVDGYHDTVAYKSVQKPKDWIKELDNLDFLKSSLSHHDRLTLHYAALIQDHDFYIFLPYTRLGDLEAFLREGTRLNDASTDVMSYDFAKAFKTFQAIDLTQEFACVMDATAYLHDKVSSVRGTPVYCVHADLRPQNILVFPGDSLHPVGVWRISDFGVSSYKLESDRSRNGLTWTNHPSVGDLFEERRSSSRSLSTSFRPPGTYMGPERQFEGFTQLKENDVWSLGCIFAEVLVFGLGSNEKGNRKEQLEDFRKERRKTQGSDLYRNDYFYDLEPLDIPIGIDTEIVFKRRDKVDEWLKIVFEGHSPLYKDLAVVVNRMLQPNPELRVTASTACKLALEICYRHRSHPEGNCDILFQDVDADMLHADQWKVLALRQASKDSHDSLIFKHQLSSHIEETLNTRQSTETHSTDSVDGSASLRMETQEVHDCFFLERVPPTEAKVLEHRFRSGDENRHSGGAFKARVSDSCGTAVYLCRRPKSARSSFRQILDTSSIYELKFRKPWQQVQDPKAEASSTHMLPNSEPVTWQDLHVNGQHAIVIGTDPRSRTKRIYIYDFVEHLEISLPPEILTERMHKIVSSANRSFLAYNDKMLTLWHLQGTRFTQSISPPLGASGQAVLGSSGDFFFTWSCRHQQDVLLIWKIYTSDKARVCVTRHIPRHEDHASREMFLIPCGSLPACIIRDVRGIWYTASLQPENKPIDKNAVVQRSLGTDLPSKRALYAANECCLFFISQTQDICACNLVWKDDATLMLDRQPKPLAKAKVTQPESIALHAKESGKYELVVCDLSGAMESIEVEC